MTPILSELPSDNVFFQGNGGPYSEFTLKEIGKNVHTRATSRSTQCLNNGLYFATEDKYVALESVLYPGQHIGVNEAGELTQPPTETSATDRTALFIPFPHSTASGVSWDSLRSICI